MKHFIVISFIFIFLWNSEFSYGHESLLKDGEDLFNEASLATLHFVSIIARHGSRAPLYTYPNDPYAYSDKRFWPQGKGELSNVGRKQLYGLGSYLRERYTGFLPLTYYPNDTLATYNPVNRDFDSVACLLAALYPPVGEEVWNSDLIWQPIPARVYDFDICQLLRNKKCPEFTSAAFKSAEAYGLKVAQNTSCLMKYVSNHTGETLKSVLQLFEITDTLAMQYENGFKLPEWTKSVYPKELNDIAVQTLNALYAGSDKILSLTAGPELIHINDLLIKKVNGSLPENSKMYIELGHDCILYSLLKAMGSLLGEEMIQTSSYLAFELHQLYSSHIVQVFYYRNYLDEDPAEVIIRDCPSPCSLENFNKFVQKIAGSESWDKACKMKTV